MMLRTPCLAAFALLASSTFAQQPTYHAVRQPAADPTVATLPAGTMLSVPGVYTDFVLSGGGQFTELPNGTARLTGRVFSDSSIYSAFLIDIEFTGHLVPTDPGYPPAGAPDLQLLPSAYVPSGTVDPNTFEYYTAASGTLTGVRNLDGAVLAVQHSGPIQVGLGANNRNAALGVQADFTVTVLQQPMFGITPAGTASLLLDLSAFHGEDATHPQPDPLRTTLAEGRAMVLPGVADDYLFVPAGRFTEYDDGHAELTGTLARLTQLDDAWDVALMLTNRIDPGEAGCPPAGSPVLQMLPSAYVANGGTMNPDHWHYYQSASGTLVGTGANDGGSITLANSVAVQVGGAANQTNTYIGYYGAFGATLTTQPTNRTLTLTGDAELFGLTATFPVLPFPSLDVPPVNPTLPTLTDQGMLLSGDNLAWAALVGLDFDIIGATDPSQWNSGYFRVLDNQHIEVHPRPGLAPGTYNLRVFNPAVLTNSIQVDLQAPATPQFFAEAAVPTNGIVHGYLHSGPVVGPTISIVVLSQTLLPSVAPGLCSLAIGNGFSDIVLDPSVYLHDPVTGIAPANYGPIPANLLGQTYYFQGLILDLGVSMLPLPETNAWGVQF
ncbi:MAG TPA: hypothetical protein VFZ65_13510 [Planctomycetota bacterium]|nr:hypothetical protein [Planctomycetota bacterium]